MWKLVINNKKTTNIVIKINYKNISLIYNMKQYNMHNYNLKILNNLSKIKEIIHNKF